MTSYLHFCPPSHLRYASLTLRHIGGNRRSEVDPSVGDRYVRTGPSLIADAIEAVPVGVQMPVLVGAGSPPPKVRGTMLPDDPCLEPIVPAREEALAPRVVTYRLNAFVDVRLAELDGVEQPQHLLVELVWRFVPEELVDVVVP